MAKKNLDQLTSMVYSIIEHARKKAYSAIKFNMIEAYWKIGYLIVEEEQYGERRAEYGKYIIKELSEKLSQSYRKGFSEPSLRNMRQFYLTFPIRSALQSESIMDIQILSALRNKLSWTHYKLLISVEGPEAREWYMNQAADNDWKTLVTNLLLE